MEKAIEETKLLIERELKKKAVGFSKNEFEGYQKFYYTTNENIGAYLDLVDFTDKSTALTVTSSGDHAFNLITKGITNIDTFDINRLTEYFVLGLKRAMVLKYNYQDFKYILISLCSPILSIEKLSEIILGLLPYMESHHRRFWQEIVDFNYSIQKMHSTNVNLFELLTRKNILVMDYNNYLRSEEEYDKLRNRISMANISFKYAHALDLPTSFSNQYDFILLSNILDYFYSVWGFDWTYDKLEEYEKGLEKLVTPGGTIFLKYIMTYISKGLKTDIIFGNSLVSPQDLTDEEVFVVPKTIFSSNESGIVLKRVNSKER